MLPGSDDVTSSTATDNGTPKLRKTTTIDRELLRLCVDVAALQETRLLDEGSIREDNYTFFWKGKNDGERRDHGVGFAVRNCLLGCIERIMHIRLLTASGPITLVSAYVPTLKAAADIKDHFYEELRKCLESVRASDNSFYSATLTQE